MITFSSGSVFWKLYANIKRDKTRHQRVFFGERNLYWRVELEKV